MASGERASCASLTKTWRSHAMRFPHTSAGTTSTPGASYTGAAPPDQLSAGTVLDRRVWIPALVCVLTLIAIAASTPAVPKLYFVVAAPQGKTGVEVFLALNQLFVALVLYLFAEPAVRPRLTWLSLGCAMMAIAGLLFGGLLAAYPAHQDHINTAMYGSIFSRICGTGCLALGLAPRNPPRLTRRRGERLLAGFVALLALLLLAEPYLPQLSQWANLTQLHATARTSRGVLPGLTAWHWMLSSIPILLATLAVVGAARRFPPRPLGNWLLLALILFDGAQIYTLLWPSAYSSILTLATFLRLAFTAVLATGAIIALNRISAERAAMLASEREMSARLTTLAMLKADFSAMVAHELTAPLAAIRRSTEMLASNPPVPIRAQALSAINAEIDLLNGLVADVQAAGASEREDFAVQLQRVPLDDIVAEAVAFALALPGDHDLQVEHATHVLVWADDRRIGQVLRNLLGNATKFSPAGATVTLRTRHLGDRVRIEVADTGPGIHPDDVPRVFEKFGRGRDAVGQRVPGVGLGLYLSRRILRSHGGDVTITSTPGNGTSFAFDLELAS